MSAMKKEGRTTADWKSELKWATNKTKKEYFETVCREGMEFQRTGCYDVMHMKMKETGWTENCGIKNISIKTLKGI